MAKYYNSITELPLKNFISCQTKEDLSYLVIEGEPSEQELLNAWITIKQEYADALGDGESKLYYKLQKDATEISIDLTLIYEYIRQLEVVYYPPFADEVNALLRTSFKFDINNPIEYKRNLKSCLDRSKEKKIRHELMKIQIESLQKKFLTAKAPDQRYYQNILISLSDFSKYPVTDNITVYEYCERFRRMNDYAQRLDAEKTKIG